VKQYILAIDLGNTNVKAAVFGTRGEEIFVSSCAGPKPVSARAGWWEQDMERQWESAAQAIRGIFGQGILPGKILGVFPTGQGNGMLLLGPGREPLRRGILSLDSRASGIVDAWQADGRYARAVRMTYMPFPAGSPLPLLAWLKANAPEQYRAADKVLFAKDWLRCRLCGHIGTDPTDASGAGLMDLRRNTYADEVFDLLGLGEIRGKLPEILPSHQVAGAVSKEAAACTGLLEGTPVLCGAHDIAAYPFGVGSLDPRQAVCAMGTWGMNLVPAASLEGLPSALYHSVPGYYLTGAGDGNSGGCLDTLLDTLCAEEKRHAAAEHRSVYAYVEDRIAGREPTEILFHPFVFGSASDSAASAGFVGVRSWHGKEDLLLAVYEGIVMGHRANLGAIPWQRELEGVWLIGGGAKSRVFGQLFADITGLPVKIPLSTEVTARGGALHALVGLGICETHAQAAIPAPLRAEYRPDPQRQSFYAQKFSIFEEWTRASRATWDRQNALRKWKEQGQWKK